MFGTARVVQEVLENRKPGKTECESKQYCVFENPMNQMDKAPVASESRLQPFNVDSNRASGSDAATSEIMQLCKIANQGVVPDRWSSVVVTRQFTL